MDGLDWWIGGLAEWKLAAWGSEVCKSVLARATAMGRRIIIIIIIIIIPTAPRIPPHHPPQREERRGVMSLVGQVLRSLSCLVAKLLSVLGCSLVE